MGDKDFFLDADDAMTMGDINYMRTSRRTRRTFPKTLKNKDGFAFENEVSSMQDRARMYRGNNNGQNSNDQNIDANTLFNPTPSTQSQPGVTGGSVVAQSNQAQSIVNVQKSVSAPTPVPQEQRRKIDTSMDMFRNMAKNIRK
jgi:hypothetical protein